MRITVIGGAGQMGQWLVNHFAALGHTVIASDIRAQAPGMFATSLDVTCTTDNISAVEDSDLVVVSVPIRQTIGVIHEVISHLKKGVVLCEISSIKGDIPATLIDVLERGYRPLCIHPMFGPGAESTDKRIVLIPLHDMEAEQELVRVLFPECVVVSATAEEHDRAMASVLSLPYFLNAVLAAVLVDEDLVLIQQMAGTTYTLQLMLLGSVMSQSSGLHLALQRENSYATDMLKRFQEKFSHALSLLIEDHSKFNVFYSQVKGEIGRTLNLEEKYKMMYRVLEVLEGSP